MVGGALSRELGARRGSCPRTALAGEQLVEHQAERVDVAPDRDLLARQLLRRHVGRRAGADLGAVDRLGEAGQPEVGDLGLAAAVDHHVGRLEIAVQDALRVGRRETGAELARSAPPCPRGRPADAAQQRGQVLAVDVLHREVVLAVDFADVVDAADVGVGDLARDAHLVEEALQPPSDRCSSASGRNFSATGWPSFRSSAR